MAAEREVVNTGESTTRSFPGLGQPPAGSAPLAANDQALREATIELSVSQITGTGAAPPQRRLTRLQWIVAGTLAGLFALAAARLLAIDGLLRRVSIDGPSMAPTYCGAHYRVACDDCRYAFRCDAVDVPSSGVVVCPNCGYRQNKLLAANRQAGERVLIDRWPLLTREPRRGEVVAARQPGANSGLVVKRVAALPGERLEIRSGDLYVGGQIIRKTLREWREVRVLVYDNDFQPAKTAGLLPRWQPASGSPRWKGAGTGFRKSSAEAIRGGSPDYLFWLRYHHWHATESIAPRTQDVPVLDNDSFNQNLSRQLNPVSDIALACQIRAADSGRFALAVTDGAQRFEALIEPSQRRVMVQASGVTIAERTFTTDFSREPIAVEFGLCDQQVFLAVAGRELLLQTYERSRGVRPVVLHPLEIGTGHFLDIEVAHLQVWRDLYYLEPLGTGRSWQSDQPLAAGEFALLGDNPPVSNDARHWPASGGVPRAGILGRIVRPFWAASP